MKFDSAVFISEIERWFSKSIIPIPENLFSRDETQKILDEFHLDYNRYYEGDMKLSNILLRGELQGILLYRCARMLYLKGNDSCNNFSSLGRFLSGIELYYSAEIGDSLKVNHGVGMVVGARVKVGKNALLHHNITIGDHNGGRPTIGDNVTIFPGALVLGHILIGNNVVIGANSVCLTSVPDGKTVAGIPAKNIIK